MGTSCGDRAYHNIRLPQACSSLPFYFGWRTRVDCGGRVVKGRRMTWRWGQGLKGRARSFCEWLARNFLDVVHGRGEEAGRPRVEGQGGGSRHLNSDLFSST